MAQTFLLLLSFALPASVAANPAHVPSASTEDTARAAQDALIPAAAAGDLARVQALIAAKVDVNARPPNRPPALIVAAVNDHLNVVKALLAANADANAKGLQGTSALMVSAYKGNLEVVRTLLDAKANINAKSDTGLTALINAAMTGKLPVVQVLLAANADVDATDRNGVTASIVAARGGHVDVLEALLAARANVNVQASDGTTALIEAAAGGYTAAVNDLIAAHADLDAKNAAGGSALTTAEQHNHRQIARILSRAAEDPNVGVVTTLADPNSPDVVDLLALHKIEAEVIGSGIQFVTVRLRRTNPGRLAVVLPTGLYFAAGNGAAQNMIGTSSRSLTLASDNWVSITVPAACTNKSLDIPSGSDSFAIQRLPHHRDLIAVMPALERAHASYPVIQAATWIITDNADFDDLGTLMERPVDQPFGGTRVIQEADAARALRIMSESGVDVTRRAIWRDRQRLADAVSDRALAAWLRGGAVP